MAFIVIESAALVWKCRTQSRRRSFDVISAIHLWADPHAEGAVARCDIAFADGDRLRLMVSDDDFAPAKGKYVEYRGFVLGLLEHLSPAQRARIDFREGPSAARRMSSIVVAGCGLAACIGGMVFGALSGAFGQEDNGWLLFPLLLLFALLMAGVLAASLRNREKPFDPAAVPPRALPPVPGSAPRDGWCRLVGHPGRRSDLAEFACDLAPRRAGILGDVDLAEEAERDDAVGIGGMRRQAP